MLRVRGGYNMFIDPAYGDIARTCFRLCPSCLVAGPSWLRSTWQIVPETTRSTIYGSCICCHEPHQVSVVASGSRTLSQLDNVLSLDRWEDRLHVPPSMPHRLESLETADLCHDCAHRWCEQVPEVGVLLEPERSHAHTAAFWEADPDHPGWDRPVRSQE